MLMDKRNSCDSQWRPTKMHCFQKVLLKQIKKNRPKTKMHIVLFILKKYIGRQNVTANRQKHNINVQKKRCHKEQKKVQWQKMLTTRMTKKLIVKCMQSVPSNNTCGCRKKIHTSCNKTQKLDTIDRQIKNERKMTIVTKRASSH